jgi:hypothetical protein
MPGLSGDRLLIFMRFKIGVAPKGIIMPPGAFILGPSGKPIS